jgi:hypothetical protein
MDDLLKRQLLAIAYDFWSQGQGLDAGQLLFEHIAPEHRPGWGANALAFALPLFPPDSDIEAVLEFAKHPEAWGRGDAGAWHAAHALVGAVNRFPYIRPEPAEQMIYTLAAMVGKVVYNAKAYPTPFDYDAGWDVVATLKRIVEHRNDPVLVDQAWQVLSAPAYLVSAIYQCHPVCPVCRIQELSCLQDQYPEW